MSFDRQSYRGKRFPPGELKGLGRAWSVIDELEEQGLPVRAEAMCGTSYRRQPHPKNPPEFQGANYILQTIFTPPQATNDGRITARYYLEEACRVLDGLDVPGDPELDHGGLHGLDPSTTRLAFGSTGDTDTDLLYIYSPWLKTVWSEAGKKCIFLVGIEPPQPRGLLEQYPFNWLTRDIRNGRIVFKPTPEGLETW